MVKADKTMPVKLPMLKIAKDGRANHRKNTAPIAVIIICNRLISLSPCLYLLNILTDFRVIYKLFHSLFKAYGFRYYLNY